MGVVGLPRNGKGPRVMCAGNAVQNVFASEADIACRALAQPSPWTGRKSLGDRPVGFFD